APRSLNLRSAGRSTSRQPVKTTWHQSAGQPPDGPTQAKKNNTGIRMRGRFILCMLGLCIPTVTRAQVPVPKSKADSIRADSVARADSIALVKQLEKELGASAADTGGAGSGQGPRATGGYMNIGFVAL